MPKTLKEIARESLAKALVSTGTKRRIAAPLVSPVEPMRVQRGTEIEFIEDTKEEVMFSVPTSTLEIEMLNDDDLSRLGGHKVILIVLRQESGQEFVEFAPTFDRESEEYIGIEVIKGGERWVVQSAVPFDPYEYMLAESARKIERERGIPCNLCLAGMTFCQDGKIQGIYEFASLILHRLDKIVNTRKAHPCACGLDFVRILINTTIFLRDCSYRW